jgi:hypothetical protein
METSGNIVVGKPDVEPSAPSHTMGVREGNKRKSMIREPGVKRAGRFMAQATVRRSTGVNAKAHQPIDPRMPVLTPA